MFRVLLVDDEKNVLTTLSIGLRRYHFNVRKAESGLEALAILNEEPCDVVISDIRMSPMDGYTLAATIREKFPDVRIVLMSAYEFEEGEPNYQKVANYSRLTKPFSIHELIETILAEGKSSDSANVLFLGDAEGAQKCSDVLKESGYCVHRLKPNLKREEELEKRNYDFYIIDGNYVNEDGIAVLNRVYCGADNRPVLLLVHDGKRRKQRIPQGFNATVFNRELFFSDRLEMLKIINTCKNSFYNREDKNN
jgi:DNA-binding response OmpR family regulator